MPRAAAGVSPALLALALGPAVALGLGRFGYGLLLPEMRIDLGWSYAQAGFVNSANAVGYLAGALGAAAILRRIEPRQALLIGMAVVTLCLFATAAVRDFTILSALRVATGAGGAVAFVAGGTLLAGAGADVARRRGFHLAAYYAGVGLGLLLAGLALPPLLAAPGSGDWPAGWLVLGGLALPLIWIVRSRTAPAGPVAPSPAGPTPSSVGSRWMLAGYLLYGTGSIGYMTFITARLDPVGTGWWPTTQFWSVFALGALVAPVLWERVLDRWSSPRAFLAVTGANALGAAMPLVPLGAVALLGSAFVFGLSFFTVVAVTTLHVSRASAPDRRARDIGRFSVMFGLGQVLGPLVVGRITDIAGSLDTGLFVGAATLGAGAVLGAAQR